MSGARELLEQRRFAREAVRCLESSGADGGRALLVLGRIERRLGNHAAAGTALRRALGIAEAVPDETERNSIRVRAFAELGTLRRAEGRHADAERLLRRALADAQQAFGPDHPEVASLNDELAEVLKRTGAAGRAY